MDKNHRENCKASVTERRMYEVVGDRNCPVLSFQLYLSKLHPSCTALWQKPKDSIQSGESVWFINSPLGKNTLAKIMSTLSEVGKLSQTYTNHSIRATSITIMDKKGIDSRHIMKVSGHASETSIKSYSHSINDAKKRQISSVLSDSLAPSHSSNSKVSRFSKDIDTAASAAATSTNTDMPMSDELSDLNCDLIGLFEEPFDLVELDTAPLSQSRPLLDTTNIQNNLLNIPANNERSNQGYISFLPKFDTNCNVTINFNNYYK